MLTVNWQPSSRQLRQFVCLASIALPFTAWMWSLSNATVLSLGAAGSCLAAIGLVWPKLANPVYLATTAITFPIGILLSEFVLLLIFLLTFIPLGLVFRLNGRNRLKLSFDTLCDSYWEDKKQPRSVASYYHQS